jgi:hypothetical protein
MLRYERDSHVSSMRLTLDSGTVRRQTATPVPQVCGPRLCRQARDADDTPFFATGWPKSLVYDTAWVAWRVGNANYTSLDLVFAIQESHTTRRVLGVRVGVRHLATGILDVFAVSEIGTWCLVVSNTGL